MNKDIGFKELIYFFGYIVGTIFVARIWILVFPKPLYAPSWYRNPFSFRQVLQALYLIAWCSITDNLARCIGYYIFYKQYGGIEYDNFMGGIGTLLGLTLSKVLLRKYLQE